MDLIVPRHRARKRCRQSVETQIDRLALGQVGPVRFQRPRGHRHLAIAQHDASGIAGPGRRAFLETRAHPRAVAVHDHAVALCAHFRLRQLGDLERQVDLQLPDFQRAVFAAAVHGRARAGIGIALDRQVARRTVQFGLVPVVIECRDLHLGQRRIDLGLVQRGLGTDQRFAGLHRRHVQVGGFALGAGARLFQFGFVALEIGRIGRLDAQHQVAGLDVAAFGHEIAQHQWRRVRRRHQDGLRVERFDFAGQQYRARRGIIATANRVCCDGGRDRNGGGVRGCDGSRYRCCGGVRRCRRDDCGGGSRYRSGGSVRGCSRGDGCAAPLPQPEAGSDDQRQQPGARQRQHGAPARGERHAASPAMRPSRN